MKYCPNCGAELLKENAAFCSECGQGLTEELQAPKKSKKDKTPPEKEKKKSKKNLKNTSDRVTATPVDDGYDGYYADVQPPDIDRVKEGMDKELIKKIAVLGAVVALVIALCVAMMYIL